jgi:hypothetical protein
MFALAHGLIGRDRRTRQPRRVVDGVVISQNRADSKREALANQQWSTVRDEDRQNEELLLLSREILEATKTLQHSGIRAERDDSP